MALDDSVLSSLLDAFRSGEGVDLIPRDELQSVGRLGLRREPLDAVDRHGVLLVTRTRDIRRFEGRGQDARVEGHLDGDAHGIVPHAKEGHCPCQSFER